MLDTKVKHLLVLPADHFAQCQMHMLALSTSGEEPCTDCYLVYWQLLQTTVYCVPFNKEWCMQAIQWLTILHGQYIIKGQVPPVNFQNQWPQSMQKEYSDFLVATRRSCERVHQNVLFLSRDTTSLPKESWTRRKKFK